MKKLVIGLLISVSVFAADWSETSVTFLRGSNFAEMFGADNNRTELSFEHASGYKYGDNFFWLDVTDPQSNSGSTDTELYGEWSPRFSFGKMFGFYNRDRFVQDVLWSNTLEFGNSGQPTRARLYGLGFDLKMPGFAFFQYNLYIRDNPDKTGTTLQSTIAYKMPINVSKKILLTWAAYIDIVHGDEGTKEDFTLTEGHWHTGQQVYLDLGNLWGSKNTIFTGIEYQYWNRKFGTPISSGGQVENNLKWMVKWVW